MKRNKKLHLLKSKEIIFYIIISVLSILVWQFGIAKLFVNTTKTFNIISYEQKKDVIRKKINNILKDCNISGVFIGWIIADNDFYDKHDIYCMNGYCGSEYEIYFNILRGIWYNDKSYKIIDTKYVNPIYQKRYSLDSNTYNALMDAHQIKSLLFVNYDIAHANNYTFISDIYRNLDTADGSLWGSYLMPIFENGNLIHILTLSFGDVRKSKCLDPNTAIPQYQILSELSLIIKSI
jgi:hypothetical protein